MISCFCYCFVNRIALNFDCVCVCERESLNIIFKEKKNKTDCQRSYQDEKSDLFIRKKGGDDQMMHLPLFKNIKKNYKKSKVRLKESVTQNKK